MFQEQWDNNFRCILATIPYIFIVNANHIDQGIFKSHTAKGQFLQLVSVIRDGRISRSMKGLCMQSLLKCPAVLVLILICLLPICASAQPISATVFAPRGVEPGSIIEIKILMQSSRQLGGIDFTIRYNDSLFTFLNVEQDTGLNAWEYFTTSHNADSNTVNIFTIADIQNGPIHPDSLDFFPKGSIARYTFFVAPNWISDSAREPFNFFWLTCGDNAVSNTRGDTLILLNRISDPTGTIIWNEPDSVNFPEANRLPNVGVPDSCLAAADRVLFSIDFRNGTATNYFICGDTDGSNSITISDAVLIISYIFSGGMPPNPLLAGDVDCSGNVTISDAVYLISYIFAGGPEACAACP